jgi:xylulokinase
VQHVLAIDLGTSGPKVALVGLDGSIADRQTGRTRLLLGPGGAAEQDPDDWWAAIGSAVTGLLGRAAVPAGDVVAVAVTCHWSGTVAVDADGRHLGNALIWMDSRGSAYVGEITGGPVRVAGYDVRRLRRFVSRAGGLPGHSGKDPTAHIAWLRHRRPDVYRAARLFLEPADYLNLRLTGRACSSFDCIALHWVADIRDVRAVRYDERLLALSGLDRDRLPDLVPSASVVGAVRDEVAARWGLPAGLPVVTASGDVASAVVGSGAVADHAAHLYIGTSSWISCHVPRKATDLFHNQTTLPSALPGRYYVANEHETAGACLDFAAATLLAHVPPHERLAVAQAEAATSAPGAGGVLFTPWLNGERSPVDDPTVRGGWHNLCLATTRADLLRAVYEGVAHNSRWLLDAVDRFVGRTRPEVAFIGGGATSSLWCQIHADILGRPVLQMAEPRMANVRGAAFVGFVALGLLDPADIPDRVPVAARYRPRPEHRACHDRHHAAFTDLYQRTRGLYARLNAAAVGRVPERR